MSCQGRSRTNYLQLFCTSLNFLLIFLHSAYIITLGFEVWRFRRLRLTLGYALQEW